MNDEMRRREFVKFLLRTGALGAAGTAGFLSRAQAAASPAMASGRPRRPLRSAPNVTEISYPQDGYKALVCVYLYGGNDSFNMIIPTDSTAYGEYSAVRGGLAVGNATLNLPDFSGAVSGGTANPYHTGGLDDTEDAFYLRGSYPGPTGSGIGINGVMPELASLIASNRASVVANVGTLVRPVTKSDITSGDAELPVFLFAHNHQQRILQTGNATNLDGTGWAGRIADEWVGVNGGSPLGLNVSFAGNDRMLIGRDTTPLALGGSPSKYRDMFNTDSIQHLDRRALFEALAGRSGVGSSAGVTFDDSSTYSTGDPFKQLYSRSLLGTFDSFDELYVRWDAIGDLIFDPTDPDNDLGPYGEPLFGVPSTALTGFHDPLSGRLISQLESVAKMIRLGADTSASGFGFNRQIFFVSMGGFDNHSGQDGKHPVLLRELSLGLWKFQKALEVLGLANNVTTFTMSDFGRTMSNNGDGTDHGWGGHHIVLGGDGSRGAGNFDGGKLFGTLPEFALAGPDDHDRRGRAIPGIGQDQLNAALCSWFGVDVDDLTTIFPNLANFESSSGNISSALLDGLFAPVTAPSP